MNFINSGLIGESWLCHLPIIDSTCLSHDFQPMLHKSNVEVCEDRHFAAR